MLGLERVAGQVGQQTFDSRALGYLSIVCIFQKGLQDDSKSVAGEGSVVWEIPSNLETLGRVLWFGRYPPSRLLAGLWCL